MKPTYHPPPTTYQLNFHRIRAYLQLMRPANIVTAWADILAGFAASGAVVLLNSEIATQSGTLLYLTCLLLSTTGLYSGGVVF